MKIYISVDLEGINGVVSDRQVLPEFPEYEKTRQLVVEEINAVAKGLQDAGVTEIVVNDSHHESLNIDIRELTEGISLISGDSRKFTMMHGLDESFDGAILLGYHAKAGTRYAIMDHTYYPDLVEDLKINDRSYGEIGLSALFAAEKNVPVIMVSGDAAAAAEAQSLMPNCKTAAVKDAQGRFCAKCLPKQEGHILLSDTAREAAAALPKEGKRNLSYRENFPAMLEIKFYKYDMADSALLVPPAKKSRERTVQIKCSDMEELFSWRQVLCSMAECAKKIY